MLRVRGVSNLPEPLGERRALEIGAGILEKIINDPGSPVSDSLTWSGRARALRDLNGL